MVLTCEYRGDCVLGLRVSYDDGLTFDTLDSFTITGLSSGARVQKKWSFPKIDFSAVVFELNVTTNDAPSEGLIINEADLLVDEAEGLIDLDPQDQA